jgi:hypothetical protein
VAAVADALSRLDIDSLKIQEEIEEVLTLLSGSENNSISNVRDILCNQQFCFTRLGIIH